MLLLSMAWRLWRSYVCPITDVDFLEEQDVVILLQPLSVRGSLKDLIYGVRVLSVTLRGHGPTCSDLDLPLNLDHCALRSPMCYDHCCPPVSYVLWPAPWLLGSMHRPHYHDGRTSLLLFTPAAHAAGVAYPPVVGKVQEETKAAAAETDRNGSTAGPGGDRVFAG